MFYGRINRSRPRITGRRTIRTPDKTKYNIIIIHIEIFFYSYIHMSKTNSDRPALDLQCTSWSVYSGRKYTCTGAISDRTLLIFDFNNYYTFLNIRRSGNGDFKILCTFRVGQYQEYAYQRYNCILYHMIHNFKVSSCIMIHFILVYCIFFVKRCKILLL